MSLRKISRDYGVSRKTVREIIRQKGGCPDRVRKDKIHLDPDKLEELYHKCDGYVQRVHEKLVEEEGTEIGYSTLTRLVRELDIAGRRPERCARVPDEAGKEMQHDTTVYHLSLGGHRLRVVASILYYRYSKQRYLKFYRSFNRFRMKCFLHEALSYYGYSARECIIDNTNLARLRGSGKNAVISPEMEAFARQYGFRFICHEVGHSDRKAGNERSFYTVETNFFPGR
ncbi:MAG: helix-turn-helix domain-containing protein, partial [Candidatus Glassbacteria bacterium]